MLRSRPVRVLVVLLLLLGALWAWASVDRCGEWRGGEAGLTAVVRARGALRAGAGEHALTPPLPVVVGGYGPRRSEATSVAAPLKARAVVWEVGGQRVGVVAVDTLLVTEREVALAREGVAFPVAVLAAHTHSSLGAHDARLAAQVAGLGAFRPEAEDAVVEAVRGALAQAVADVGPATVAATGREVEGLSGPRSGQSADARVTVLRLTRPDGAPVAQVVVLAAHPTLVPRRTTALDPDYPGRVAELEAAARGVTLVLQGAAGNAVARGPADGSAHTAQTYAARVAGAVEALDAGPAVEEVELGWASASLEQPRPDATRLVPAGLRAAAENALCAEGPARAQLSALHLGPLRLLLVPGEPSHAAGLVLEEQAGADRVVGLADGYLGYVELEQAARAGEGESRRQYFPAELVGAWARAARLVGTAAGLRGP